jgi:myo-inositol-1(or 4)-monophosphatase
MTEKAGSMPDPDLQNTESDLDLLTRAALAAGKEAMKFFRNDVEIWWKNEGSSPVTAADHAANDILLSVLRAARPHYGWLSEESEDSPDRLSHERVFIIDPIDGTRAFMNGRDTWAVSAAITDNGRPIAGVLYAPALNELYRADESGYLEKNGQPFAVGPKADRPLRLSASDEMLKRVPSDIRGNIERIANIPSLAYRIAMVADGRLDATLVRPNSHDWDLAAAHLILENAGGRLTDIHGREPVYNQPLPRHGILIAARPDIHEKLLQEKAAT